jgi:hypothetical protein
VNKLAFVTLCACLTISPASAKETSKPADPEKVELKESLENIKPVTENPRAKDLVNTVRMEVSIQDVAEGYVDLVITGALPCCSERELPPLEKTDKDSSLLHRYHRMFNLHFTRAYHRWLDENPSCRLFSTEITATRIKQFPINGGGAAADFNIPVGGTARCVCPEGHDGPLFDIPHDLH